MLGRTPCNQEDVFTREFTHEDQPSNVGLEFLFPLPAHVHANKEIANSHYQWRK